MNIRYIFLLTLITALFFSVQTKAQTTTTAAPPILWQKVYGGSGDDILSGVDPLAESILLSGYSNSGISGNKTDSSGGFDFWLLKVNNSTGKVDLEKSYGGDFDDTATKILHTTDGGYLLAGTSRSLRSGDKIQSAWGFSPDYWVLKLDKTGRVIWQRNLGGTFTEKVTGLTENSFGYGVSGHSYSDASGDKTTDNTGFENRADLWQVFLETDGHTKRTDTYGTVGQDLSCCLVASDGGSIIGSTTFSRATQGQKTRDPYGQCDYWVVRTDLSGARVYDSTFGGTLSDFMTCMIATHNGYIMLGGYSNSDATGIKSENSRGGYDFWIIKMKQDGTLIWQKTIGGDGNDYMTSLKETRDGGFIAGGYSNSNISGEKSEASRGGNDYWIVKLDSLGNKEWDKTYGGSGDEKLTSVDEISLGNYILSGTSNSPQSGDKDTTTIGGTGKSDFWIIRLGKDTGTNVTPPPVDTAKGKYHMSVLNNPVGNGTMQVRYSSPGDETVRFVMYSYDGKKVLTFSLNASKTTQTQPVSIAKLPKGVYYLTMYSQGKKVTAMVVRQ